MFFRPHIEAAVPGLIDQGIIIHGSIQQIQLAIPPPPQNPPPPPPPGKKYFLVQFRYLVILYYFPGF